MLLAADNDDLFAARSSLTPAHRRVRDHLLPDVLLLKAAGRVHAINRLGLAGTGACSRSRGRRLGHLHIVTVRRAKFRSILLHLLYDPILIAKVIDAVKEGRLRLLVLRLLLLLGLLWIRTVKIKCFSLLIADRIGARIIKGVIVSR